MAPSAAAWACLGGFTGLALGKPMQQKMAPQCVYTRPLPLRQMLTLLVVCCMLKPLLHQDVRVRRSCCSCTYSGGFNTHLWMNKAGRRILLPTDRHSHEVNTKVACCKRGFRQLVKNCNFRTTTLILRVLDT